MFKVITLLLLILSSGLDLFEGERRGDHINRQGRNSRGRNKRDKTARNSTKLNPVKP